MITRYGVNPICNWFFESKSGLITALSKEDFINHRKVFILNPAGGEAISDTRQKAATEMPLTENEKYAIMRQNILVPGGINPIFKTDNFEVFELTEPPDNWVFDSEGLWQGYR